MILIQCKDLLATCVLPYRVIFASKALEIVLFKGIKSTIVVIKILIHSLLNI